MFMFLLYGSEYLVDIYTGKVFQNDIQITERLASMGDENQSTYIHSKAIRGKHGYELSYLSSNMCH